MEILSVIPARGGSKGIIRKNIKVLAGEPLLAYTIHEARKSKYITRVVVSTEDDEIARVAEEYGVRVPFRRPNELALDHVTDLPVFQHCLLWLKEKEGYTPDILVHLRPTAPLRTADHIDTGIELLLASPDADCVRSVTCVAQHPLKMWSLEDGYLAPFISGEMSGIREAYNMPRQKLPPAYIQNGAVDVIRAEVLLTKGSMSGDIIKAFIMKEDESVNIDNPLDWELAEILMNRRRRRMSGFD
jgi:N-acylneuraminate cytidylyltransferase